MMDWPAWIEADARARLEAAGISPADPRLKSARRAALLLTISERLEEMVALFDDLAEIEADEASLKVTRLVWGEPKQDDRLVRVVKVVPGLDLIGALYPSMLDLLTARVGTDVLLSELTGAIEKATGGTCRMEGEIVGVIGAMPGYAEGQSFGLVEIDPAPEV